MSYSKDEIFIIVQTAMVDLFEIAPEKITLESWLYEDLDIDSIDAVDLIIELKDKTGKKPDVESFRHVRSVSDVVDAVYNLTK